jgi:hypothetical protein
MKKRTKRRQRRQASPRSDKLRAYLATADKEGLVRSRGSVVAALVPVQSGLPLPAPSFAFNAYTISAAKDRSGGPRPEYGPFEWAQAAIGMLYPFGLPKSINKSRLRRDGNELLAQDPEYKKMLYGKLDRKTFVAALAKMRERNP